MSRLVAIVGPTGVGKSRLALHLAGLYNGEIVSADSRQVYRHLNIGTDKPLPAEQSQVPHHLIDVADPDEEFSLAQYQSLAGSAIDDILGRGKLPLLVGGSGLYVWAVLEGWEVPGIPPDTEFRYNLERRAGEEGGQALYQELLMVDPEAARKIDPRNVRRVIRALEVHGKAGAPFSRLGKKQAPAFESLIIGLTADRQELYRRTDQRVEVMFTRGLVAEVENLIKIGYDLKLPAMSGIGYRQVGRLLRGELTLEAAKQQIKTETHRLVRHQYAWFRLKDERIHWFDIQNQEYSEIAKILEHFLESRSG